MHTSDRLPWCQPASKPDPIGWGIVGPGGIAGVFAGAVARAGGWAGRLERVCGRSVERSAAFAERHGGRAAESLEELLGDASVHAVYVATPHPMHAAPVEAALKAGKAVLCEKPMTTSAAETRRLIGIANERGVLLVEAWMYRTHPQIARLGELIREGAIGRVTRVESVFGMPNPNGPPKRLIDPSLGGGAVWDIGGYPLSLAMLVAQAATGEMIEPRLISASGEVSDAVVDLHAEGEFDLAGVRASLAVSIVRRLGVTGIVHGEGGSISLPHPFLPGGSREGTRGELVIETPKGVRTEKMESSLDCFAMEAVAVAELHGRRGTEPEWPMVDHSESVRLAKGFDAWRGGLGA